MSLRSEHSSPFTLFFPPELPISQRRDEIVSAIQAHQTIVLTGETGSGKTTQIPKMCLDAGLGKNGRIACTQPRRVAALSVAKRVAEELGVEFGAEVGAKIRFTDQTNKNTRVKFMTDGIMLTEIHRDPLMRDYEAVIIDEAHERSLNIDFLLGHLNQLRARRPDLKIIITSATIDTDKFSAAFDNAPIIEVSGRVYPVDIIYAPLDELLEESGDFTYIEGIAESAQRIQDEFGPGDILAFLPTEKDIREAMDLLDTRFGRRMEVIPCFGRLSNADQQRIFQSSPRRKLILATNIAETSLTIPGIHFVIDTGLARISRYNPRSRTKRLPIVKVSQSSANQRSGRCGRVANGLCIRLYSEKDYKSREVYSVPEIQRSNLADVILRMIASQLGDVESFPFIDPPSPAAIAAGYQLLEELGALSSSTAKDEKRKVKSEKADFTLHPSQFTLSPLGEKLARLPADPTVGRMLLEADRHSVTHEVLVIAAALSIQDPRERPMDKESAARQAHAQFDHKHSDFLSLLNIWEALHDDFEKLSQSRLRKFCKKNFLNYLRIREWRDIYQQLQRALPKGCSAAPRANNSTTESSPHKTQNPEPSNLPRDCATYHAIHACLLTGLLANVGRREEVNLYLCSANRKPLVFPGSSLFIRQARDKNRKRKSPGTESGSKKKQGPEWILSGEIVETNRLYARTVASIDPNWILEVGSHILTRSYSDPEFEPEQGRVVARESTRIHGLEIQNKKISYLKVDPVKATEIFIREALLNEDYDAPANWTFLAPNRRLLSRIQNAQTVISIAHWMGVEEAAFTFYQKNLQSIASNADLNRLLKVASAVPANSSQGRQTLDPRHLPKVASAVPADSSQGRQTLEPHHLPKVASAVPADSSQGRQTLEPHLTSNTDLTHLPSTRPQKPKTKNPEPLNLMLSESDLIRTDSESIDLSLFPETMQLENSALPIEYQYKHGHEKDGVTLKLPYHQAKSVNDALLDWLVPGHLEAKTHALLKALPKQIRQRLIPLAETAKTISKVLRPTGATLIAALQQHLSQTYSIETYASDWDESAIPEHLRARIEVHDKKGNTIAEARDAQTLHTRLEAKQAELSATKANDTASLWEKARQKHEREITSISDLRNLSTQNPTPKTQHPIKIGSPNGIPLYAYPALRATAAESEISNSKSQIRLTLFRTPKDATTSNETGIAALLEHELRRELAWIRTDLKEVQRVGTAAVPFRPIAELKEDVYEHIRQTLCTHGLTTLDPNMLHSTREKAHERSKGILYKTVDQLKLILEKRQALVIQPALLTQFAADIDRLLPPDFLRHTPHHILPRLPVYLECLQRRFNTHGQNPARDAQRQAQLDHYRSRLTQLATQNPKPRTQNPIAHLRFQIEEFAVSLFAQHLGTAHPISAKKLDQAFDQAGITSAPLLGTSPTNDIPQNPKPKTQNPGASSGPDKPTKADLDSLKNLFK